MKYKTKIKKLIEKHNELRELCNELAQIYVEKFGFRDEEDYIDQIDIEDERIVVTGETPSHCSCCQGDSFIYEIPISYLWDADWIENETNTRLEENIAAVVARVEREKKEELEAKNNRKNTYYTLKKEFENENKNTN